MSDSQAPFIRRDGRSRHAPFDQSPLPLRRVADADRVIEIATAQSRDDTGDADPPVLPGVDTEGGMSRPFIVIAEDDAELRELLRRGLREEGFAAETVSTGGELLRRVDSAFPDALVVDIGLPDADGRDVCQALRARGVQAPVLFLTARDALVDRISGFDAGGDDYVSKPFAFAELVVRLQALLRRSGGEGGIEAAGVRLNPVTHSVERGAAAVALTPTEFRLLARLLARPGEAVRRKELARAGWTHGATVRANTLDAYVARLRRKLRGLEGAPPIVTVHGVGYRIG
jgi:two-component system, OmpR family, response regulator